VTSSSLEDVIVGFYCMCAVLLPCAYQTEAYEPRRQVDEQGRPISGQRYTEPEYRREPMYEGKREERGYERGYERERGYGGPATAGGAGAVLGTARGDEERRQWERERTAHEAELERQRAGRERIAPRDEEKPLGQKMKEAVGLGGTSGFHEEHRRVSARTMQCSANEEP
jgi:hypothetical protein